MKLYKNYMDTNNRTVDTYVASVYKITTEGLPGKHSQSSYQQSFFPFHINFWDQRVNTTSPHQRVLR